MARPRVPPAILSVVVLVTALAIVGCGDDDTTTTAGGGGSPDTSVVQPVRAEPFEPATSGTALRWYETPGECQVCGFTLELDISGVATYSGFDDDGTEVSSTVDVDAVELRDRLTRVGDAPLVVGTDDCGREVDGNAPVLELVAADGEVITVDDCFDTIDRDHPLMRFVLEVVASAESAAGVSG